MGSAKYSLAVLFLLLSLLGCAQIQGSAAGGQASDYANGSLVAGFDKGVMGAYEASVKAMTDLGMTIRRSDKNAGGGIIEATRPDDMKWVAIIFKAQGPRYTTANIKVGESGDEEYSRMVARRIEARLNG